MTDVGSTKRSVVAAVDDPRFVGGHPLAGAETAGVEHARPISSQGATWYLTPTARTGGMLYERLHRLLVDLGARPAALDAETHDALLATVSHLPHVLANVLVARAARVLSEEGERLPATGPVVPRRHARGGRQHGDLARHLPRQRRRAGRRDRRHGAAARRGARRACRCATRRPWRPGTRARARSAGGCSRPTWPAARCTSCASSVPNRPGVVAEVALALGRAGVNILDMALYPASDMSPARSPCGWRRRSADEAQAARRGPRPDGGAAVNVRFAPGEPLRGTVVAPPDKSLSHRAALMAAMTDEPVRDHRLPRRRRHELDARRRAGARRAGRAARRLAGRARRRPAGGGAGRRDRRRQRRHADAAAAGLAGRAGRGALDARRRRLDPAPPGRPDRRAAAADGRVDRRARGPLPAVHGGRAARCAGSSTSCRSPPRRSSRACCWPGCSPREPPRWSSRSRAATTPSGCWPPPAPRSPATATA